MSLEKVWPAAGKAPGLRSEIRVDKIGSATSRLSLGETLQLLPPAAARIGDVVVVRTLTDNSNYNKLELTSGRLARVNPHDIVAGVLGRRQALKGFVGEVPTALETGQILHLLNLGGVIGYCTGHHHELGTPIEVELLGMASSEGQVLNISQVALEPVSVLNGSVPLVLIAGTSMNSGKTHVANELIKHFSRSGFRVAGGKLSGVACLRDTLDMQDHGACSTLSFLDCGYPSTVELDDLAPLTRTIIGHLSKAKPDLIVLEMGDGILGGYHVDSIFESREIMSRCGAVVFCAGDFVGAWGGIELLRNKGIEVNVVSGSVTDSRMGVDFVEGKLGVSAANALNGGERLFALVREKLEKWQSAG